MLFHEKGEKNMCQKIKELNGMSADDVLNRYWSPNRIPVDITKILFDMNINVIPTDFSEVEKKSDIAKGSILGAIVTHGDSLAVLYKEGESLNRTRFTLSHELAHCCLSHIVPSQKGHVELRRDDSYNDIKERAANVFAGELLIPKRSLAAVLQKYYADTFPHSTELSKLFAVSVNVMEERLKHLRIPFIDSNEMKVIVGD